MTEMPQNTVSDTSDNVSRDVMKSSKILAKTVPIIWLEIKTSVLMSPSLDRGPGELDLPGPGVPRRGRMMAALAVFPSSVSLGLSFPSTFFLNSRRQEFEIPIKGNFKTYSNSRLVFQIPVNGFL